MLRLIEDAGIFALGALAGAGGLAALKARVTTDVKDAVADIKTEAGKLSKGAGASIIAKAEALLKKL